MGSFWPIPRSTSAGGGAVALTSSAPPTEHGTSGRCPRNSWEEMPPWVFCTEPGTPLDESRVRKNFAAALDHAKLESFRVYDLRHTFASLLLADRAPLPYVAAQLGHSRPTTTLQFYAHW